MSTIKFYIDKNKAKDGIVPIKANIYFENKPHWKVIEKVKLRYWNQKKQRVTPNRALEPDNRHAKINKLLDDYQAKANNSFNYCRLNNIQITEKHIREILNGEELKEKSKYDFNDIFLKFLEDTKATKGHRTFTGYQTVYRFFLKYQEYNKEKLTFENMNLDFFDRFKNYCYNMRERKTTTNYFAKNITVLKTFLTWSKKREYHNESKYMEFSAPEIDVENINLSAEEVIKLRDFNFDQEILNQVRDIFIFGCYTALRYSDLHDLKWEHIQGDYIEKTIIKTKNLERFGIIDQAKEIMKKYNDPVYVLPHIVHQNYNSHLKDCCRLAGITQQTVKTTHYGSETKEEIIPKYERISAHVSRKTAATILISKKMPESLVKGVTGHKTDKELQKYVGPMGDTIKTETQKAWNLVTNTKDQNTDSEMSDEDIVNLLKKSIKSRMGNKQKLIDYLNSLEGSESEK